MVISEDLLFSHEATLENYEAGDAVFSGRYCSEILFPDQTRHRETEYVLEDGKEFVHGFPLTGIALVKAIYLLIIIMPLMPLL